MKQKQTSKYLIPKMVIVTWEDATQTGDEAIPIEEIDQTTVLTLSVGLVVKEDKKGIVIARDMFETGDARQVLSIPKKFIKKIYRCSECKKAA